MNVNFAGKIVSLPNWFIVASGLFLLIAIVLAIFQEINLEPDLTDSAGLKATENLFAEEFKKIKIPPKTAVNKTETWSKLRVGVTLKTRYRTELAFDEFIKIFRAQLEQNGWINYQGEKFCRGKYDAELTHESLFLRDDNADYYTLTFRLGTREKSLSKNDIPEICY